MRYLLNILIILGFVCFGGITYSADNSDSQASGSDTSSKKAKSKKKKDKSGSNSNSTKKKGLSRERHISREAQSKKGDTTKIDFEAADIAGERKVPLGSLVNTSKDDRNYDFVKIRQRWHDEMVQSAASLDTRATRVEE